MITVPVCAYHHQYPITIMQQLCDVVIAGSLGVYTVDYILNTVNIVK